MILPSKRRAAGVAIGRLGQDCAVLEPSTSQSTNGYGKPTSETFDRVAVEKAVRVYGGGGSSPESKRHTGGRLPADSPLLLFRHNTVVESGYRVEYGNATYEIDSVAVYPTHVEAATTLVN